MKKKKQKLKWTIPLSKNRLDKNKWMKAGFQSLNILKIISGILWKFIFSQGLLKF